MRRFAACATLVALGGCAGSPNPPAHRSPAAPETNPAPPPRSALPPQWFIAYESRFVERNEAGVTRLVADGMRVEVRGRKIVAFANKPEQIDDASAAPPWIGSVDAPCRYVFWRDRKVYGVAEWLGEPRQLDTPPLRVHSAFEWFDGVGLVTSAGRFVVHAGTCAVDKVDAPGAAMMLAASENRALTLSVFGHSRLTLDGGKTFREVTAELPEAMEMRRDGSNLHVLTQGDAWFVLNAQGAITAAKRLEHKNDEMEPDAEDRWPPEHSLVSAIHAAGLNGLLLPSGEAIAADGGLLARIDLQAARATEVLRFGAEGETCIPVSVSDRALAVCEAPRRAFVVDAGSGHVERSFDLEAEPTWDRFVLADGEALGFVGACSGRTPPSPADVVTSASPSNMSPQRSPVFCVRTNSGTWVQHQLDPADATDVLAWIPRIDGGAVALVALPGTFIKDTPRVEQRGELRIIRVARNAPPLNISPYMSDSSKLLARAFRALPDGSIEGWIASGHGATSLMAVAIDAAGYPRQRPIPERTVALATAGRFALVRTEDNRYFETTDFGREFRQIDAPPGGRADPAFVSAVGGQLGAFVRIGWGAAAKPPAPILPPQNTAPDMFNPLGRQAPAAVRLGCRFTGPTTSSRISDSFALGFTKNASPQMSPGRIDLAGAFYIPWRGGQVPLTGDADVVFVPLLDLAAPVKRATVPLSRLGSEQQYHPHQIRLGFVLDGSTVWPVATSRYGRCAAPLVDDPGLTVPIGGCVEDPTVGVVHEGRVVLVHQAYGKYTISTANLPSVRSEKTKLQGTNLKEIATIPAPNGTDQYTIGVGLRKTNPVVIAVDVQGQGVLAPLDAQRGTLGAEEPLIALKNMLLATDKRCAEAPDDARVVLPFEGEIGLLPSGLPGVRSTDTGGVAIVRWSNRRACLEAIDLSVYDERHEAELGTYASAASVRKLVVRFDAQNQGKGTLAVIGFGSEVRQPVTCDGISP